MIDSCRQGGQDGIEKATEEMLSLFQTIPFLIVTPSCSICIVLAGLGNESLLLPVASLIEEEEGRNVCPGPD